MVPESDRTLPEDQHAEYELVVEGYIDPSRSAWFEGMSLHPQAGGRTLITGPVTDQAALFALVSRIRDFGLRLVSINRKSYD
jgi:hypothetical protein